MKSDDIQKCWEDPKSWKHFYYYCKEDPRVIVPKRGVWQRWGWTINFAHPMAWLHLIASIILSPLALIGIAFILSKFTGLSLCSWTIAIAAIVMTITLLCLSASHQSSTKRFDT